MWKTGSAMSIQMSPLHDSLIVRRWGAAERIRSSHLSLFEENTMSDKKKLQEKLKNDVELAQVKLAEFKANIKSVAGSV